jgi:phage tail-like protein
MADEFIFRLQIQGPESSWTFDIPIGSEPVSIGRQAGVDLLLENQQISRRHAVLHCTPTECQITDLKSANGTRVNGQKLTPQVPVVLKPGDSIQIGAFNLEFEQIPIAASLEEAPPDLPHFEKAATGNEGSEIPIPLLNLSEAPARPPFDPSQPPPCLTFRSDRLLNYLPGIYHTDFMANFLAIFESVLFPVEWQIDNFDLFLDPGTAPSSFLPWLANWFEFGFDSTWSEAQKRRFLKEAYAIHAGYGTRWALSRVLEIYSGCEPEIDDQSQDLAPHTFRVRLPKDSSYDQASIERLIDAYKPTHTTYILELYG